MTLKKLPKNYSIKDKLHEIIRVDHAGEYGAKRIYQGQLSVLKNNKDIKHMLEQELEHLEYFETQMKQRNVRPTLLSPTWHIGGFALGAVSAILGKEAAMATTVAVEEVIDEHYQEQLNELKQFGTKESEEMAHRIHKFREEELEHRQTGIDHGAYNTFAYSLFTGVVKSITKTAIFLSKRI